MAIMKKSTTIKAGEDMEKREPSYLVGENGNRCHPLWRIVWKFLKN